MTLSTRIQAGICGALIALTNAGAGYAGVKSTQNVLTNVSKHVLAIESSTTVANSIGVQKTATIILRCEGRQFDAYIWTPTWNGVKDLGRVHTRWDDGKITSGFWSTSTDYKSYFHSRPASFVGELASNKMFVFGWEPRSTQPVAARWDLNQHKNDILEIKRLCNI